MGRQSKVTPEGGECSVGLVEVNSVLALCSTNPQFYSKSLSSFMSAAENV